jgi:hypothetical protein
MKQEIQKNNKNLTIKLSIPLKTRRFNPYDESENDEMDNIIGVIAGDEVGFSYRTDRRYKDKGDDVSAPFYFYHGGSEDFKNLCGKLDIAVVEYPTCVYCYQSIFGSFTLGQKWNKCFDCEEDADLSYK